jgi:hypothetical protein
MRSTWLRSALVFLIAFISTLAIEGGAEARELRPTVKTPKPLPQALWVMGADIISVFPPGNLKKSGFVGSSRIKAHINLGTLTFDANRNLWIGFCGYQFHNILAEVTPAGLHQLAAFGSVKFKVIIQDDTRTEDYLGCARGLQFDNSGNLWVQSPATYRHPVALLKYSKVHLQAGGSPVPDAVIETPAVVYGVQPVGMAMDHAGDLWLADTAVVEYSAEQLAAGVQTDPIQTLDVGVITPLSPFRLQAIAFDAEDNLWGVSEFGGILNSGSLKMFAAADLQGQGTIAVTPKISIGAVWYGKRHPLKSIDDPISLAFDSKGDLWVGNREGSYGGHSGLVEFTPSQLSVDGSPVPVRYILGNTLSTNLDVPYVVTFGTPL